jgi:hypothetical protein
MYETFPTLSDKSEILFTSGSFDHPVVEITFENKTSDVRPTTDAGLHEDLVISMKLHAEDFALVGDFVRQMKGRATKFYVDHPHLGNRVLVRIAGKFEWSVLVSGNPSYYDARLTVREVFSNA